jgi:hypothetical protein
MCIRDRNSTTPTSTVFTVNSDANTNGVTYVAYLFAHNAGGFGTTGTDNVISCGSFTTDGSGNATINLGYEPQYLMLKWTSTTSNWFMIDSMRGFGNTGNAQLYANNSNGESQENPSAIRVTSTGFTINSWVADGTGIYIAIRRPMKTPTTGTEVFLPQLVNTSAPAYRASFTIDAVLAMQRTGGSHYMGSRLIGTGILATNNTNVESSYSAETWDYQTSALNYSSLPIYEVGQCFRRASGFFDVVCYKGTGTLTPIAHNLTVAPELIIYKRRNAVQDWWVVDYVRDKAGKLNLTDAFTNAGTSPNYLVTSTTMVPYLNTGGLTYVSYLFATCPNVSKVGSYTGTGATQTINAGLASGARFVMIKRTDSTGDWFVWDTARGMVAGTDPRLALNSNAAESNANWVYTASTGFQIVTTDASVNASGGTYIYLAIA